MMKIAMAFKNTAGHRSATKLAGAFSLQNNTVFLRVIFQVLHSLMCIQFTDPVFKRCAAFLLRILPVEQHSTNNNNALNDLLIIGCYIQ